MDLSHNGTTPATISGFTIQNGDGYGIYCSGPHTITGCTIRNNGGNGIRATSVSTIIGNTITGNIAAIVLHPEASNSTVSGNTITGNALDCIGISGGTISSSVTWRSQNAPYYVAQAIVIGETGTLTIEPGRIVKFNISTKMTVEGTLVADASGGNSIYFTSIRDDTVGGDTNGDTSLPAPGNWASIDFLHP